jgi:hypothetical protein
VDPFGGRDRRQEWDAGGASQQRSATEDARRNYEAWPWDYPVEIAARRIALGFAFGAGEGGCTTWSRTDRRDVDYAPDAFLLATREKRRRCSDMDPHEIITGSVLEGANAVHHGIDSGKQDMPGFRRCQFLEVRLDPPGVRKSSTCFRMLRPAATISLGAAFAPMRLRWRST